MKTIEELVSEVKKNLGVPDAPVARQTPKSDKPQVMPAVKTALANKMTLDMAKRVAKAAEIAAKAVGVSVVVTVCNDGANTVLLHAMDDSLIASVKASQDKAYTAMALKMPTHKALEESRGGSLDGLTNGNGILLLGGGYPLIKDNIIYGSVGVSGGTKEQDALIAAAAAEYFRISPE